MLNDTVRDRLQTITVATARARQYKSEFRHLMLHGPPGTGKTLFARRLAYQVRLLCASFLQAYSFGFLFVCLLACLFFPALRPCLLLTACKSGLDYAMLAGGDVGPLGTAAVTELHRVFDWAESSRKG